MKNFTFNSLSFSNPKGDTLPGFKFKISFKSFCEAKLKERVLFLFLNSFKLIFLIHLNVIRN